MQQSRDGLHEATAKLPRRPRDPITSGNPCLIFFYPPESSSSVLCAKTIFELKSMILSGNRYVKKATFFYICDNRE